MKSKQNFPIKNYSSATGTDWFNH